MVQWIKVRVAKLEDLHFIPRTQMVEKQSQLQKSFPWSRAPNNLRKIKLINLRKIGKQTNKKQVARYFY